MLGLYDINGMLRFTGSDKEECKAYAELLEIASEDYSLMDLPDSKQIKAHPKRHQAKNNN